MLSLLCAFPSASPVKKNIFLKATEATKIFEATELQQAGDKMDDDIM